MKNWRKRPQESDALDPTISLDELAWRIGASEVRPAAPDPATAGAEGVDDLFIGLDPAEAADIARALAKPAKATDPAASPASLASSEVAPRTQPPAPAASIPPASVAAVPMQPRPAVADQASINPVMPYPEVGAHVGRGAGTPLPAAPPIAAAIAGAAPPAHDRPTGTSTSRGPAVAESSRMDAVAATIRKPDAKRAGAAATVRVKSVRTRRAGIWRDTSAVLIGVVGIVLIAQLALASGGDTAQATSTPGSSPLATNVAVLPTAPPATITPPSLGPTLGPVIDPSLIPGIEATPTPSPSPTPSPTPTPRITPKPTVKPTPKPTPTPGPPIAIITLPAANVCIAPGSVSFTAAVSAGSTYAWDFDDGGSASTRTTAHIFAFRPVPYTVILTVSKTGFSPKQDTVVIDVSC